MGRFKRQMQIYNLFLPICMSISFIWLNRTVFTQSLLHGWRGHAQPRVHGKVFSKVSLSAPAVFNSFYLSIINNLISANANLVHCPHQIQNHFYHLQNPCVPQIPWNASGSKGKQLSIRAFCLNRTAENLISMIHIS